ncbi:unnamed protein product [Prunus brigantina]
MTESLQHDLVLSPARLSLSDKSRISRMLAGLLVDSSMLVTKSKALRLHGGGGHRPVPAAIWWFKEVIRGCEWCGNSSLYLVVHRGLRMWLDGTGSHGGC